MTLKAKLGKILSSSAKLSETSTDIFEKSEKFLRPRLKGVVESLQAELLDGIPVSPVVAGGFIRDTLVGALPKDLDIFIKFEEALDEFDRDHFKGLILKRLREGEEDPEGRGRIGNVPMFFGAHDLSFDYKQAEDGGQLLDGVIDFQTNVHYTYEDGLWSPPHIQLIAHRSELNELLDRFDINICKVAYVPSADEFIYTPEFLDDFHNKKVTLDPRYKHNVASLKRYKRIESKMRNAWNPPADTYTVYTSSSTSTNLKILKWENEFFQQAIADERQMQNAQRMVNQWGNERIGGIPIVEVNEEQMREQFPDVD